jgi:hypothetical protein
VFTDSDPLIQVDVSKVNRSRDQLEPVIGHEIGHVYDAYFKYGIPKFLELIKEESTLPWGSRTLEQSAIVFENSIRLELHQSGNYPSMAQTREDQNQRVLG